MASALRQRRCKHSARLRAAPQWSGSCFSISSNVSSAISYSPSSRAVSPSWASASKGSWSGVTSLGGGDSVGPVEQHPDLADGGIQLCRLGAEEVDVTGLRVAVHVAEAPLGGGHVDVEMLAIQEVHRGGLVPRRVQGGVQVAVERGDPIRLSVLDRGRDPAVHVIDLLANDREGSLGRALVPRPLAGRSDEENREENRVPRSPTHAQPPYFHKYTMENTKTQTTSTKCQYQDAALNGKCCCGVICPRSTAP